MAAEHHLRRGFTLIELLIVFSLVAILVSMTAVGIARVMQRSAVQQAVSAIEDMSTQARLLAVKTPAPIDGTRYGTVIAFDTDQHRAFVGLIKYKNNDGKSSDRARIIGDNRRWLSPNAVVYVSGRQLSADSGNNEVAWYYEPSTGVTLKRSGGSFEGPGVTVGLPQLTLKTPSGMTVFGATPETVVPTIAPGDGVIPGLAVRTRDDRYRYAIAVYASGTLAIGDF